MNLKYLNNLICGFKRWEIYLKNIYMILDKSNCNIAGTVHEFMVRDCITSIVWIDLWMFDYVDKTYTQ